jgi:hypothetical protein
MIFLESQAMFFTLNSTKVYSLLRVAMLTVSISQTSSAAIVTLYDGNGLPTDEPWLAYGSDQLLSGGMASQSAMAGSVQLVTDDAVSAGYSNYNILGNLQNVNFPSLNPSTGFEVSFELRVQAELHSNNDRAGFSIILLGSDSKGIELGFWTNEIWAQSSSPLFTHQEGVLIDTTDPRDYRLRILNNSYTLLAGSTPILGGPVRDYSAFAGFPDPYERPNFLFLGDDTSSARGIVTLGTISLQSELVSVPEPSSVLLLLSTLTFGCIRRVARQRIS